LAALIRSAFLTGCVAACGAVSAQDPDLQVRSFADLEALAAKVAAEPFQPTPPLPEDLAKLEYDQYRMIAFEHHRAIGFNTERPFWLETFHRGYVHTDQVKLNSIGENATAPIPYRPEMFQFRGPLKGMRPPADLGFAGMRVIGNYPGKDEKNEMLVFVGASYYRARVKDHPYGTSVRGIALDAAMNKPEEFPLFREFWVVEPKPGDETFVTLAEMDGPSVTGAYRFEFSPLADRSVMDVEATLYFRRAPDKVGLAPMTSMWMWGDGIAAPAGDHRPSVHDADGLLIENVDGSWFWRALSRQSYPSTVRYDRPEGVRGFGLIQRDTNYDHFKDDEALYHQRPSVWVQPISGFDAGSVELFELASPHEGIDNIVAYWIPSKPIVPGEPLKLKYRVTFFNGDLPSQTVAKATETRILRGKKGEPIVVEIDFAGGELDQIKEGEELRADLLTISSSLIDSSISVREPGTRTLSLKIQPEDVPAIGLEATLRVGDRTLSETWSYLCAVETPPTSLPPWRQKELEQEAAAAAEAKDGSVSAEPASQQPVVRKDGK
jgi:glucans biosynthesis protein